MENDQNKLKQSQYSAMSDSGSPSVSIILAPKLEPLLVSSYQMWKTQFEALGRDFDVFYDILWGQKFNLIFLSYPGIFVL